VVTTMLKKVPHLRKVFPLNLRTIGKDDRGLSQEEGIGVNLWRGVRS
jgi:hypothetical protein